MILSHFLNPDIHRGNHTYYMTKNFHIIPFSLTHITILSVSFFKKIKIEMTLKVLIWLIRRKRKRRKKRRRKRRKRRKNKCEKYNQMLKIIMS